MEHGLPQMIDSALRGAAAAAVLLSAISLLRDGSQSWVGRFGALFGLGILNYLVCSASWFVNLPSPIFEIVLTFCFVNPVLFWLFSRALFDDEFSPGILEACVAGGIIGFGFARHFWGAAFPSALQDASVIVMQLVTILLVAHIFTLALQGRRDDLIEERRRFRLVFVIGIGAYVLLVSIAEISLAGQQPPESLRSLNVLGILLLTLVVNLRINQLRRDELLGKLAQPQHQIPAGATAATAPASAPENRSGALGEAASIDHFMRTERAYLIEGLTINALAQKLKMPEYKLRHAINQQMGFRNFPAFLNFYRIEEAKRILADPEQARIPILTIALDLGYGSIGPFNRAFKLDTGMPPTAFRKAAVEPKGP